MGQKGHIPVRILDKEIREFRKALNNWSGSSHYKRGMLENVDMINADGDFTLWATHTVEKYSRRIRNRWKGGAVELDEKHKSDLLKIAHYAGLIYDSLK